MSSNRFFSHRWPLIFLVGCALAIPTGGIIFWSLPESSQIVAYLQVKSNPTTMGALEKQQRLTPKDFEIFQQTQLTLLKSQFLLDSALSQPEISQLDAVVRAEPDPVLWLKEELRVNFPGKGEILEVRYDGNENPEEMKKVVDAVIDAYEQEVLNKERCKSNELRRRLSKWNTKEDVTQQSVQIMQAATASRNMNTAQRLNVSMCGGLVALCLTCLGGVLMRCNTNTPKTRTID